MESRNVSATLARNFPGSHRSTGIDCLQLRDQKSYAEASSGVPTVYTVMSVPSFAMTPHTIVHQEHFRAVYPINQTQTYL